MIDHQYTENRSKNINPNYNQMKAYCEYYPNQPKKLYLIDIFIEQSDKLWRFRKILAGLVYDFYQGVLF